MRDNVEPSFSLHYWDFTQKPVEIGLLGKKGLFGASDGMVGPPFDILHNKGIEQGSRGRIDPDDPNAPPQTLDFTLPPQEIKRNIDESRFPFVIPTSKGEEVYSDEKLINAEEIDIFGNPILQLRQ